MKIADVNSGQALQILMTKRKISREKLAFDIALSKVTISSLRNSRLISGRNLVMLCEYFEISASEYFKLGESEEGGE